MVSLQSPRNCRMWLYGLFLIGMLSVACRPRSVPTPAPPAPVPAARVTEVAPPPGTSVPSPTDPAAESVSESVQDSPAPADEGSPADGSSATEAADSNSLGGGVPDSSQATDPSHKTPNNLVSGPTIAAPQPRRDWAEQPHFRFLLSTPQGPILWAFAIELEGRDLRAAYARLLNNLLRDADANRDDRTDWAELWQSPPIKYGYLGTVQATSSQQQFEQQRQRDFDRNGVVSPAELEVFLMGQRRRSGPLQWNDDLLLEGFRGLDGTLMAWLDADQDGSASNAEWQDLASRLTLLDLNGDRSLALSELTERLNTDPAPDDDTAISGEKIWHALDTKTRWEELHYSLEQCYSGGGTLRISDLGHAAGTWNRLDADRDEELALDELRAVTTVPPQILVQFRFRSADESPDVQIWQSDGRQDDPHGVPLPGSSADGDSPRDAVNPVEWRRVSESPDGKHYFSWYGLPLILTWDDFAVNQRPEESAEKLVRQFDGDANGYLDEMEGARLSSVLNTAFANLDKNSDKMLYAAELGEVISDQLRYGAHLVELQSRFSVDAWGGLDLDRDTRVGEREWAAGLQRLTASEQSASGAASSGIISSAGVDGARGWSLQIVRGNTPLASTLRSISAANNLASQNQVVADQPATTAENGEPSASSDRESSDVWLRAMDANRDGEVSWREFLGSRPQFDALDADGDQFIELEELHKLVP